MNKKIVQGVKGFTLVELLVVISIISVISSVVLVSTASAKKRSQDAVITSEVRQVKTALDLYALSKGGYPNPEPGFKKLYCVGDY
jgi:general secretion pathway protein G